MSEPNEHAEHLYTVCFTRQQGNDKKDYGFKSGMTGIEKNIDERLKTHTTTVGKLSLSLKGIHAFALSHNLGQSKYGTIFENFLLNVGFFKRPKDTDCRGDFFSSKKTMSTDILGHGKDSWPKWAGSGWKKEAFVPSGASQSQVKGFLDEGGCQNRLRFVQSIFHTKIIFDDEKFGDCLRENESNEHVVELCLGIHELLSNDNVDGSIIDRTLELWNRLPEELRTCLDEKKIFLEQGVCDLLGFCIGIAC